MVDDVHPDPPGELLAACEAAIPGWMRASIAARVAGSGERSDVISTTADAESTELLGELRRLLTADVDEQETTPLALIRRAVTRRPTELLRSLGVVAPEAERFAAEAFPDDPYRLGPAAWAEVDPALHEPGLVWGAWKAMTVLRRRRDEGQR